jgi:hypothetical protein
MQARDIGMQTGLPQQVSTAHSEFGGHEKLAPQASRVLHAVLPGVQNPPPPGWIVVHTQSELGAHPGMKVLHVAPAHSGLGLHVPFTHFPSGQQMLSGPQAEVPVLHTHVHVTGSSAFPGGHVMPDGQAQVPLWQVWAPRQSVSSQQFAFGMQAPLQSLNPLLQVKPHVPLMHVSVAFAGGAGHLLPQAPQLSVVFRGVHTPLQQPCPAAHLLPQAPQLLVVFRGVHAPLQQPSPREHLSPHLLQLLTSPSRPSPWFFTWFGTASGSTQINVTGLVVEPVLWQTPTFGEGQGPGLPGV